MASLLSIKPHQFLFLQGHPPPHLLIVRLHKHYKQLFCHFREVDTGLGEVNCPRLHTQCQSKDLNLSGSEPRACMASQQPDSGPNQHHLQIPPTLKNYPFVASVTAELFSIQDHHWLISHWVPQHASLAHASSNPDEILLLPERGCEKSLLALL